MQLDNSTSVLGVQALYQASIQNGAAFPLRSCLLVRLARVRARARTKDEGKGNAEEVKRTISLCLQAISGGTPPNPDTRRGASLMRLSIRYTTSLDSRGKKSSPPVGVGRSKGHTHIRLPTLPYRRETLRRARSHLNDPVSLLYLAGVGTEEPVSNCDLKNSGRIPR